MLGETFREAWELAPALGAVLLHCSRSKELAARGSSREYAGSSRRRRAGHGNEERKTSKGAKKAVGKVAAALKAAAFHSKAFN